MAQITLQFSSASTMDSPVIAVLTQGEVSHVDCVMPDGTLLGARGDGVLVRNANYGQVFGMTNVWRVTLPARDVQVQAWLEFLREQIGKPYDYEAVAGLAIGRDWHDPTKWFCSELAAASLEVAQVFPCRLHAGASKITPQELLLICSAFAPCEQGEAAR